MVLTAPGEIDRFLQAELVRHRVGQVTAVEAAGWLDDAGLLRDSPTRPGLPLRKLLRAGVLGSGEQRPPAKGGNWFIVRRNLDAAESASASSPARSVPQARRDYERPEQPAERVGHRVTIEWMGEEIVTLDDLLPHELSVLCIGINPAPLSVRRGHYYQGRAGQRFLGRLRAVDLLPAYDGRWEDDVGFDLGIGQTDIVKRPSPNAKTISPAEFAYGKRALGERLEGLKAKLVIFPFKGAATKLFGDFDGHGLLAGLTLADGKVFVMPGPYEKREVADRSLSKLRAWAERHVRPSH